MLLLLLLLFLRSFCTTRGRNGCRLALAVPVGIAGGHRCRRGIRRGHGSGVGVFVFVLFLALAGRTLLFFGFQRWRCCSSSFVVGGVLARRQVGIGFPVFFHCFPVAFDFVGVPRWQDKPVLNEGKSPERVGCDAPGFVVVVGHSLDGSGQRHCGEFVVKIPEVVFVVHV